MSLVHRIARTRTYQENAGPFIKWAGGKSRLLEQLSALLPTQVDRYFEPFVGGGALFFGLQPDNAVLSDVNEELIHLYQTVRDDVESLIADLQRHRYERTYYYMVRALDPLRLSTIERASRMVYLNRTCFNGLYRVNRRGHFNVPFGRYTNPSICQTDKLRAASEALDGVTIEVRNYAAVLDAASEGDFVYFDPPYDPISRTANFTSYTQGDFGSDDQRRLADLFAKLDAKGVQCMLSNSDTPFVRELYADFNIDTVLAPRAISRSAKGRQPVHEVVVRNYS